MDVLLHYVLLLCKGVFHVVPFAVWLSSLWYQFGQCFSGVEFEISHYPSTINFLDISSWILASTWSMNRIISIILTCIDTVVLTIQYTLDRTKLTVQWRTLFSLLESSYIWQVCKSPGWHLSLHRHLFSSAHFTSSYKRPDSSTHRSPKSSNHTLKQNGDPESLQQYTPYSSSSEAYTASSNGKTLLQTLTPYTHGMYQSKIYQLQKTTSSSLSLVSSWDIYNMTWYGCFSTKKRIMMQGWWCTTPSLLPLHIMFWKGVTSVNHLHGLVSVNCPRRFCISDGSMLSWGKKTVSGISFGPLCSRWRLWVWELLGMDWACGICGSIIGIGRNCLWVYMLWLGVFMWGICWMCFGVGLCYIRLSRIWRGGEIVWIMVVNSLDVCILGFEGGRFDGDWCLSYWILYKRKTSLHRIMRMFLVLSQFTSMHCTHSTLFGLFCRPDAIILKETQCYLPGRLIIVPW